MTPPSSRTKAKPAGRAPKAKPRPRAAASGSPRRFRSGRIVRTGLIVATIAGGVGLAAIPVGDWLDQQGELDDARLRRTELQAEIDEIEGEIESIIGAEGIEERGRCFGPYVSPGAETYSIPGVSGCVEQP